MVEFGTRELAEFLGKPLQTIYSWKRNEILKPTASQGRYGFCDVLAAKIAIELQQHGVDLGAVKPLIDWIQSKDSDAIAKRPVVFWGSDSCPVACRRGQSIGDVRHPLFMLDVGHRRDVLSSELKTFGNAQ